MAGIWDILRSLAGTAPEPAAPSRTPASPSSPPSDGPYDVAYAYSPRESVKSGGKVHLTLRAPLRAGRLVRAAGDALCRPRARFWGLDGGRTLDDFRRYGCPRCRELAERLDADGVLPFPLERP